MTFNILNHLNKTILIICYIKLTHYDLQLIILDNIMKNKMKI